MVYYFICELFDPPLTIYLGEDKFVNEELIRYGFPEDIWFHVDGVSSAHVYLRLPMGMGLDDIPPDVLEDCGQLTKANSISGCKQDSVKVYQLTIGDYPFVIITIKLPSCTWW